MSAPAIDDLGHGIRAIDTGTAGLSGVTAGYLIDAPRPTLIECGPALSIGTVIDALRGLGMEPGDLAQLLVSHVHLDHAGGAGDMAEAFPGATVIVSEVGAHHLIDPERLNSSSRRVYGELMDTVYGDCTPTPRQRVRAVADGDVVDLGGGRRLDIVFSPGHAKHHISALDSDSGTLFVGDSVGVRMPGMTAIRPATPPPDFDLVLAGRTLRRYQELAPAAVMLSHYGGVGPPAAALQQAFERLQLWAETAERAWSEHSELDHVSETLAQRFADEVAPGSDDPDVVRRAQLMNNPRSNAMGLIRYFEQRREGKTAT
ncbi:MAG: MBL fold metallo-hydrolase [Actinomycetota bacterium]|nr:MBL fold metallo-hydrolase [Actinomycetota bacterium]